MSNLERGCGDEREHLEATVKYRLEEYRQAVNRYQNHIIRRHGGNPVLGCHDCNGWKTQVKNCSSSLDDARSRLSVYDYNNH